LLAVPSLPSIRAQAGLTSLCSRPGQLSASSPPVPAFRSPLSAPRHPATILPPRTDPDSIPALGRSSPPSPPVFDPSSLFSTSSPAFHLTKLYTPAPIYKYPTYVPHPAEQITTIEAPWGSMTMRGSYYLVDEPGDAMSGVYGSTVDAWRETNRLVEGEMEGKGVWVKVGVVRALQVTDVPQSSIVGGPSQVGSRTKANDPRTAVETAAG